MHRNMDDGVFTPPEAAPARGVAVKAQREITVTNEHGLHARPAMQVVDLANRFQSDITLSKEPTPNDPQPGVVDAKSVMQVITLAAVPGTRLKLVADGPDAEEAVEQISRLFEEKFGEDD